MSANHDGNMNSGVNNAINAGAEASSTPNVDAALEKEATSSENAESILGQSPPEETQGESKNESLLGNQQEEAEGDQEGVSEQPEVIEYEDFTVPEEVKIDPERMTEAKSEFAKLGFSQKQAQGAMDLYAKEVGRFQNEYQTAYDHQTNRWASEVKQDPELGGSDVKLKESIAKAERSLARFDKDKGLTNFLIDTKLGNHPELMRFLVNVDNMTSEGSMATGKSGGQPKELTDEEIFFGEQARENAAYRRAQQ